MQNSVSTSELWRVNAKGTEKYPFSVKIECLTTTLTLAHETRSEPRTGRRAFIATVQCVHSNRAVISYAFFGVRRPRDRTEDTRSLVETTV